MATWVKLTIDAKPITTKSYDGLFYEVPGGGMVGIRKASKSGGLTMDIKIPGIPISKIHLP